MSTQGPTGNTRFAQYRQALQALSTRTGAPLPSLVLSFAILHEATAILPIAAFFLGARQLGVGERVVAAVTSTASEGEDNILKQKSRQWVHEGEQWAERVGRRYGLFGFEKGKRNETDALTPHSDGLLAQTGSRALSPHLAGDVANFVVAYGVTKVR